MLFDSKLDTTGLHCPLAIVKTKEAISQLAPGGVLLVIATDPSFVIDCKAYIRQTGDELLQSWQDGEKSYYLLRKNTIDR